MKQVHEVNVTFGPWGLSVSPDPVDVRIGEGLKFNLPPNEEVSIEFEEHGGYRGPFREAIGQERGLLGDGANQTGPVDRPPAHKSGEFWKYTISLRRGPVEARLDPGVMVRNGDDQP